MRATGDSLAFQAWVHSLSWEALLESMEFAFLSDSHHGAAANNNTSQELQLLKEMIQLQTPPPTPIHPRALSFRPASVNTATDGRNESARIQRDRRHRPRLFQWVPQNSFHSTPSRKLQRIGGKRSLPPQTFNVVARKFVAADGTRWSLGCTNEQLEADYALLQGTELVQAPNGSPAYGRFFPRSISTVKSLVRLLQVASRGNFMNASAVKNANAPLTLAYTALWFSPTERWFSLPMYLASRFEVSLWSSFLAQQTIASQPSVPLGSWRMTIESKLSATAIRRAVARAVADTLALQVLPEDALQLSRLRDSIMWSMLEQNETAAQYQNWLVGFGSASRELAIGNILDELLACPLIQVGLPVDDLRRLVRQRLHLLLSREMEQALLQELSMNQGTQTVVRSKVPTKRKKKKKGRRKKQAQRSSDHVETLAKVNEVVEMEDESSSEETEVYGRHPNISFPDNGTSARDRNRNTVVALSVLEDVMHTVFVQVGIEPIQVESVEESNDLETPRTDQSIPSGHERPVPPVTHGAEATVPGEVHRSPPTETAMQSLWQPEEDRLFHTTEPGTPDTSTYSNTPLNPNNRNTVDVFSAHYGTHGGGFFHRSEPFDLTWGLTDAAMDDWGRAQGFASRDTSILTEFFPTPRERVKAVVREQASSTAASIASSSPGDDETEVEIVGKDDDSEIDVVIEIESVELDLSESVLEETTGVVVASEDDTLVEEQSPITRTEEARLLKTPSPNHDTTDEDEHLSQLGYPSPEAPSTPPPTLSPILVSLADLKGLRGETIERVMPPLPMKLPSARSLPGVQANSLPNSPHESAKPKLNTSLSRENLRSTSIGEDLQSEGARALVSRSMSEAGREPPQRVAVVGPARANEEHEAKGSVRRSIDALAPYRSPSVRPLMSSDDNDIKQARGTPPRSSGTSGLDWTEVTPKSVSSVKTARSNPSLKPFSDIHFDSTTRTRVRADGDMRTHSERLVSMTATGDDQLPNDSHRGHTNDADSSRVTKDDETTTITSALSHRGPDREPENVSALREERDTYRDMCLTLGAEVAKLKNMLAAQKGAALYPDLAYGESLAQSIPDPGVFDPRAVSHYYQNTPRARTLAAMSDAGLRGEHDSQASEDDGGARTLRHVSSGATVAGSDVSWDHASSQLRHLPPPTRYVNDPVSLNGTHSRLAKDIVKFLESTNAQLRQQNAKRNKAVERMTRLVKAVWPRAGVKLYGSHVTGLCVPSSDLDFVICLPAVHKNEPADAPGALEGRNAINESSQRLLSRKLKGESWIDPRSMKLIERTVVPVIKVATKDTKARTLQLDITFDSPGHHGLEAVDMVTQIMTELPMLRPLVLVLKQFLLDRCLLTAYTGGLSSYCLFLMVARYLQEQPSSFGDCGSLLMGFLDFYGNCFDPRSTGISVRYRQYFARPNYAPSTAGQPMWTPPPHTHVPSQAPVERSTDFIRRNSFGSIEVVKGVPATKPRPPRFQPTPRIGFRPAEITPPTENDTYTFDPLFVEDPLSAGNNVGRNAFRIVQVQRAFSDAHRALVAALEWDMHEHEDEADYALLKCLLQSEDVVFDL